MINYPILDITNGSAESTINFLNPMTGFHLSEWKTKITPPKTVMGESPLADGGKVVHRRFSHAKEVFEFDIDGLDQEEIALSIWKLVQTMENAVAYHLPSSAVEVVTYIKAKPSLLSSSQYAVIYDYAIPGIGNLLEQPFDGEKKPAISSLTIEITRGHWLPNPPHEPVFTPCGSYTDEAYRPTVILEQADANGTYSVLYDEVNNVIVVGGDGLTYRSTDGGFTWSSVAHGSGEIRSLFRSSTGVYFAGSNGIITRSTNNGASWSTATSAPSDAVSNIFEYNGRIIATTAGLVSTAASEIFRSTNANGTSWSLFSYFPQPAPFRGATVKGSVVLVGEYRSLDGGLNWQIADTGWVGIGGTQLLPSGTILGFAYNSVWISEDDGVSWEVNQYFSDSTAIEYDPYTGSVYLGVSGSTDYVYKSINQGLSFGQYVGFDGSTSGANDIVALPNGTLIITSAAGIHRVDPGISIVEIEGDQENGYPVSNKYSAPQAMTSVFYYDSSAGTYTSIANQAGSSLFAGIVPNTGDYLYIGMMAGETPILFNNLVADIREIPNIRTTWTLQVYGGVDGWVSPEYRSNGGAGNGILSRLGIQVITWNYPTNVGTVAVNGVTTYWIRFEIPASSFSASDLVVLNNKLYTCCSSWFNVRADVVDGNIAAMLKMTISNVSDRGNKYGIYNPARPINRVVLGLRVGNPYFVSRLNAYGPNAYGISVGLGTNVTLVASARESSGGYALYNPAGAEAIASRVTFNIDSGVSKQWSGRFKVFVRLYQQGGTAGDISVSISVNSQRGAITFTSDVVTLRSTLDDEVVEFPSVKIRSLSSSEIGDNMYISVNASSLSGTPNLRIKEVVMIPADDWVMDSVDTANNYNSVIGSNANPNAPGNMLLVDSASQYKRGLLTSIVEESRGQVEISRWMSSSPSPAILHPHVHQRVFAFFMATDQFGSSNPIWLSNPHTICSIKLYTHGCYLGMIGDNQ